MAVVCFQYITFLKFDITVDYILLLFSFCSSLIAYNFIKYSEIVFFKTQKKSNSLKLICFLTIISILICLTITPKLTSSALVLLFVISLLTVFYIFPFNSVNKNLRKRPGLKIFIVAIVWSLLIVVLPTVNFNYVLDASLLIYFVQILTFVVVIILPFEIRDLKFDSIKLKTIPQLLGLKKTKQLAYLLLIFFLSMNFVIQSPSMVYLISDFIIALFTAYLICITKENQAKHFASFGVESIPILWLLIIFCLELSIG